jgi:hypothetical protein
MPSENSEFEDAMDEALADRGDTVNEETEEDKAAASDQNDTKAAKGGKEPAADAEVEEESGEDESEEESVTKEPMLPKSRYDSVAARNRDLEARIAELEAQGKQKEANAAKEKQVTDTEASIAELDIKYAEAVKDGDAESMAQIRAQQREAERELLRAEMQQTGQSSAEFAQEQVRLDLTIDAIEEQYPQLDPNADDYNESLVNEIQELRAGFEATGRYSPTQALIKSVKTLVPESTAPAPEVAETPAPDQKKLKKKIAAANKQPPNLDDVGDQGNSGGMDSTDPDPTQMSVEDLEALPESTLKRMRGDVY